MLTFGALGSFLGIPYSTYQAIQSRKHPTGSVLRRTYLRKMILFPIVSFTFVFTIGTFCENLVSKLGKKYLSHLSDNDLKNFEYYY